MASQAAAHVWPSKSQMVPSPFIIMSGMPVMKLTRPSSIQVKNAEMVSQAPARKPEIAPGMPATNVVMLSHSPEKKPEMESPAPDRKLEIASGIPATNVVMLSHSPEKKPLIHPQAAFQASTMVSQAPTSTGHTSSHLTMRSTMAAMINPMPTMIHVIGDASRALFITHCAAAATRSAAASTPTAMAMPWMSAGFSLAHATKESSLGVNQVSASATLSNTVVAKGSSASLTLFTAIWNFSGPSRVSSWALRMVSPVAPIDCWSVFRSKVPDLSAARNCGAPSVPKIFPAVVSAAASFPAARKF